MRWSPPGSVESRAERACVLIGWLVGGPHADYRRSMGGDGSVAGSPVARPKNLSEPDEVVRFPGYTEYIVEIGDLTVARVIQDPGWVYSRDMATIDQGRWCEAHHVGVTVSGRQGVVLRDGSRQEFGPDDVYDIPPGHDGYTIGDEPAVMFEWSGPRTFGGRSSSRNRVLTTLLFTDLVGSTETLLGSATQPGATCCPATMRRTAPCSSATGDARLRRPATACSPCSRLPRPPCVARATCEPPRSGKGCTCESASTLARWCASTSKPPPDAWFKWELEKTDWAQAEVVWPGHGEPPLKTAWVNAREGSRSLPRHPLAPGRPAPPEAPRAPRP